MGAEEFTINWIAVIAATLSSFFIGGLWYGPLFGKAWAEASGLSDEVLAQRNLVKVFGTSLLLAFIASINLAFFIGPNPSFWFATGAGAAAGIGWVATFLGILTLFEARNPKAYWINAGYCSISLTVMGMILGAL